LRQNVILSHEESFARAQQLRADGQRVIALVDGEHHPDTARDALDGLAQTREVAAVVFCGGREKVGKDVLASPERYYGRPVVNAPTPEQALRSVVAKTGATAVVDLADEPVLAPPERMRLAALALHLGLGYEAPGLVLRPPVYEAVDFDGVKLAVIGTGKRAGKTAVAGHWAALLRQQGHQPVIVCMGRGGPAAPELAGPETTLDDLLAVAAEGRHAASDYLEDAALAGVTTVGCRRAGGGLAGEPYESNFAIGAALAASLGPDALIFEGSGSCIPPVEADRTVCIVGDRAGALDHLGPYRLLRADLALVMSGDEQLCRAVNQVCPGRTIACALRPEPAEPLPPDARVAVFTTGAREVDGVDPLLVSTNLANRDVLDQDVDHARQLGCDVYLIEVKAAGIDTVAAQAHDQGARVVLLRNRPVGLGADVDAALLELAEVSATAEGRRTVPTSASSGGRGGWRPRSPGPQ
jgi:cyclic 2,3-diphosphoglycerate synthetase